MAAKLSYDELRTVFDACDPARSGYIAFDDFAGLARQYGDVNDDLLQNAEQLLEDKYHRRLSFHEFSNIIENMFQSKELLQSGDDAAESVGSGEGESKKPAIQVTSSSDPNLLDAESRTDKSPNAKTRGSVASKAETSSRGDFEEDRYEDFGDGEAVGLGRNGTLRGTWPIHRVANLPETPSGSMHRVASQSLSPRGPGAQSRRSSRASEVPSVGVLHDELIGNLDSNFDALNDKMVILQRQVEQLTKSQENSESRSTQLKLENQRLMDRVNMLEEQLHDTRARSEQDLQTERQRYRELQTKYDRELVDVAEFTKSRIQLLEANCNDLRNDCANYRSQNERLKGESQRLETDLRETRSSAEQSESEHRKCASKMSKLQKQIAEQQQLIADLNGELDSSRTRSRQSDNSVVSDNTVSLDESVNVTVDSLSLRIVELEEQVRRLSSENRSLKEQNEELQGSILSGNLDRGRRLAFQRCIERQGSNSSSHRASFIEEEHSLAVELEQFGEQSREEILDQLIKEKDANQKMRVYVDQIILKVLEKHPEILEKK